MITFEKVKEKAQTFKPNLPWEVEFSSETVKGLCENCADELYEDGRRTYFGEDWEDAESMSIAEDWEKGGPHKCRSCQEDLCYNHLDEETIDYQYNSIMGMSNEEVQRGVEEDHLAWIFMQVFNGVSKRQQQQMVYKLYNQNQTKLEL